MTDEDRGLPAVLAEAHDVWPAAFGRWYDFEPDDEFESAATTTRWWHEQTGNPGAGAAPFRVFARDGTGGLVAFWEREPEMPVESQPVVFFSSEGGIDVIARDLGDYLWLLGGGLAPLEAVFGLDGEPEPVPALLALAQRHTRASPRSPERVMEAGRLLVPGLTAFVEAACRYDDSASG
ncbi:hypothetical protein [Catenuloplanes japonicus]|uniref:hypothetical protein n=1 Tax=Catenuloplanes japonicus TaxID=33876 RepID=UPI0007C4640B|nr:hypothetical protein [Catenuloplanes japonicus]